MTKRNHTFDLRKFEDVKCTLWSGKYGNYLDLVRM